MKKMLFAIAICIAAVDAYGQCKLTAFTIPNKSVLCGDSVLIAVNAVGIGPVLVSENFDSLGANGWTYSASAVSGNPCSPAGVDSTGHTWMGNFAYTPRFMESPVFDFSGAATGARVCFDLLFGVQGVTAPCEGPDEPNEGLFLQYNLVGDTTWYEIHYFDPNGGTDPLLTNWNNWCFDLPPAALAPAVKLRLFQDSASGIDYDHWGVDNLAVVENDTTYAITWPDGSSLGPGNYSSMNVSPFFFKNDTTVWVTMTNGSFTCSDSVNIKITMPILTADAGGDTTIAQGSCVQLSGNAENIRLPAADKTYATTEFINIAPAPGVFGIIDIQVDYLIIDSVGSKMISVCLDTMTGVATDTLQLFLICPAGDSIILATFPSPLINVQNICFSDAASAPLNPSNPSANGPFKPTQPLSDLSGCSANGKWRLLFKTKNPLAFAAVNLVRAYLRFQDDSLPGNVNFSWSPAANLTNSSTLTPTACPQNAHEQYVLTVRDDHGCAVAADTVNIFTTGYSLVWPGDANDDLVANNYDLLPIGLYHGRTGSGRDSISNLWIGHNAMNWQDSTGNGYFLKHADCNGDGMINDADTAAIHLNYGKTHPRSSGLNSRTGEPPLTLLPRQLVYLPGDTIVLDVMIGDSANHATDLYGFGFNILLEKSLIQPGSIELSYNNSFLGLTNDLLQLAKIFDATATAEAAVSRRDHNAKSGLGKIAEVRFVVNSDISGIITTNAQFTAYTAIDANGDSLFFEIQAPANIIIDGTTGILLDMAAMDFSIFPNPAKEKITVAYSLEEKSVVQFKIRDLPGKTILETPAMIMMPGKYQSVYDLPRIADQAVIAEIIVNGYGAAKLLIIAAK